MPSTGWCICNSYSYPTPKSRPNFWVSDTAVRVRLQVKGSSTGLHNRLTYNYSKAQKALFGTKRKVRIYILRTEHAYVTVKKSVLAARGKISYHNLFWEEKGIGKSHVCSVVFYISVLTETNIWLKLLFKTNMMMLYLTQCQLRIWLYHMYQSSWIPMKVLAQLHS